MSRQVTSVTWLFDPAGKWYTEMQTREQLEKCIDRLALELAQSRAAHRRTAEALDSLRDQIHHPPDEGLEHAKPERLSGS